MIQSNFPTGSGGGGGGLALAAVTNITTMTAHGKVYVKWTDPDDIVVAGSTLATWAGTLLVRKAGSPPVSRRDGTVVLDSKVRNAYQSSYFCDSGLTDGVTYYYMFFPYTTANAYTEDDDDKFNATPAAVAVGNVSSMSAAAGGDGKLNICWTDPDATVVQDGVTLATWGSTKVVVKAGGYATDPDDSDAAFSFNSTTRNAYASSPLTATGLTNGTTYYITFFPISTDGAVNTNVSNRMTGVANYMAIANKPSQSGSITYDGSTKYASWSNFDSSKMDKVEVGHVNAGTYNDTTFTPKSDYMWSDGTRSAYTPNWTIGRAAPSKPTCSPTSVTLNTSAQSATFTVARSGDGNITATSSDTSVATTSVNNTTGVVTVNSVAGTSGTATITVKVAQGTNYTAYTASDVTVGVTASFLPVKKTLNNQTWAEIRQVSDAGKGSEYWSVGDGKQITINGTIGTTAISNFSCYAFILGFNHNSAKEGSNRIHFQIGRTAASSGNHIALVSSTYGNYDGNAGSFTMNPAANSSASTNSGGWNSSNMRTVLLGSQNSPTSPGSNTFLAALPSDLRAVMKSVTKYTDNTGGGSDTASYVTATTDYLFLLSEFEVQGARTYANSAEQNSQARYAYYTAGNTKVFNKHNANTTAAIWWLRSPLASNTTSFCIVNTNGNANINGSGYSRGVAPGFVV